MPDVYDLPKWKSNKKQNKSGTKSDIPIITKNRVIYLHLEKNVCRKKKTTTTKLVAQFTLIRVLSSPMHIEIYGNEQNE